ncbi:DUF4864 domain-containing protein [Litorivicinus lipolyticus]|uniref:DUF4864 domain-containing protein n=1 Tax=Litorivicinus lipolyticus TaxID=418701 RepID=A0A5Q2Q9I4_9GAMM|nr:DUF4864 domain-containing protein [Litorivicinus lipolyticus]QGG80918.1 DUF4864 domain-containing protein [Litorivicinus lipolyticus]
MRYTLLCLALIFPAAQADDAPLDVMRSLLLALQTNDDSNAGIAQVFDQAAPSNKAATGPLPRFISMVSRHPYVELLQHQSADIGPALARGNTQQYPIRLITKTGHAMGYLWTLEQQPNQQWMTTTVRPVALGQSIKGL